MEPRLTEARLAELTAEIVSAFVTNKLLPARELPGFIKSISGSFSCEWTAAEPEELRACLRRIPRTAAM